MNKTKATKKALLMSMLSMLICVAMLIGSTFAWFTDNVTSGRNKITAGNLDVELEYVTAKAAKEKSAITEEDWQPVKADTPNLFDDDALWEPGHTEYVYLRVRNNGSLALKYNLSASVYGADDGETPEAEYTNMKGKSVKLSQFLVFNVIDDTEIVTDRESLWMKDPDAEKAAMGKLDSLKTDGKVLYPAKSGESPSEKAFTLAIYMPTTVDNDANWIGAEKAAGEEAPQIFLGLNLNATQTPYEKDSFDDRYDALLTLTGTELAGALSSSTEPEAAFGGDIHLGHDGFAANFDINGDKEINLNGYTVYGPDEGYGDGLEIEGSNVSFTNGTFKQEGSLSCVQVYPGSTVTFDQMSFVSEHTERDLGSIVKITAESDDTGAKTTVVFNECTFDGAVPSFSGNYSDPLELDVQFIGCTFKNIKAASSTDSCFGFNDDVWGSVLIDGCEINFDGVNYGSAIRLKGIDAEHQITLTMKNTTFDITRDYHIKKMGAYANFVDGEGNIYKLNGVEGSIRIDG